CARRLRLFYAMDYW
nr:immunoglobulin heavy chain junction region [Mus musculus]